MSTSQSIASIIQQLAQSQAQIAMQKGQVNAGMIQGLAGIPAGIMGMKQDMADRSDYREDRELRRGSLQRAGEMQGLQIDQAKRHTAMQAEIQEAVSTISDPIERLTVTNQLVSQKYPEELPAFQAHVAKTLEPLKTGNPQAFHEAYGRITGNMTDFNPTDPVLERQMTLQGERDKQADRAMQERARIEAEQRKLTEAGLDKRQTTQLTAAAGENEKNRQARLNAARISAAKRPDGPTPYQSKRLEVDLRKEFNSSPIVKEYDDVRKQMARVESAIEQAKTSKNFVAIDQALINGLNKMIDPQSVVREGEYARTIQNSPLLSRVVGKIDQIRGGGGGFTNEERNALTSMMRDFYKDAEGLYSTHASEYERLAEAGGMDKSQIVINRDKIAPKSGGGGPARIVQHNKKTGAYRHSEDGGQTWQPGQ